MVELPLCNSVDVSFEGIRVTVFEDTVKGKFAIKLSKAESRFNRF
jgi:hypothetical protein